MINPIGYFSIMFAVAAVALVVPAMILDRPRIIISGFICILISLVLSGYAALSRSSATAPFECKRYWLKDIRETFYVVCENSENTKESLICPGFTEIKVDDRKQYQCRNVIGENVTITIKDNL